jgi:hypothetical protein
MRADFEVVFDPDEWRTAGPIPETHLSVDAAIHYATEAALKRLN